MKKINRAAGLVLLVSLASFLGKASVATGGFTTFGFFDGR